MSKQTGLTIFDREKKRYITIDTEQQQFAAMVHQQVLLGVFVSAIALKKIIDDKLFLALGCETQEEYFESMTPYSSRQGYRLLTIARKFDSVYGALGSNEIKQISEGKVTPVSHGKGSKHVINAEKLGELGIRKLYELAKFEDEELKELIKKGKAKINGEDISLDEIKDMTARELTKQVKEVKDKYMAKLSKVTEENKLLKEEKKSLNSKIEQMQEDVEEADQLARQFGPAASRLKEKKQYVIKAEELLNEFRHTLFRCGVSEDDPEELQKQLVSIIRKIDETHKNAIMHYENVTGNF